MKRNSTPIWKVAATAGGTALTASAVWMNAEHIAAGDGWASPLVFAGVVVTLCAAVTPPFAERSFRSGQWGKGAALWLFFALAVAFSLTASIGRSSVHKDAETAEAGRSNLTASLAQEGYLTAQKAAEAECASGRGRECRKKEAALEDTRRALQAAPAVKAADPGSQRLASVLGVSEATVSLYSPLALPLGLELGGFIFLATGLSPRRRETAKRADKPAEKTAKAPKPAKASRPARKLKALPRPVPLLPAGAVAFDRRAAMRAEI